MNHSLSFIETQFPVSKVSKESYKERMANYSQTLTGLGKWWGRKPLVLVRATILGLLLPSTDNPDKDREVFLRLMTMDEDGLWERKQLSGKKLKVKDIVEILTDDKHQERVARKVQNFESLPHAVHDLRTELSKYITESNGKCSWVKKIDPATKESLEKLAFESLYYDEKIDYCVRPEHVPNLPEASWKIVNEHLGTKASSLTELVEELGIRRFGHRPKVGDAFCGGGSIPFEAARMGCDVYASDLNPVAALLTWAGLNIIGGGAEVADEVKKAQEEIYHAVDKQVTEWGIEHNEWGHRADAYLYCVEVIDPETGWKVPLAPSFVIGEKTKTVAILEPIESEKCYRLKIVMDATDAQMKEAKKGTVDGSYVVHPKNPNKVPMSLIRRENTTGLRLWENADILPRPEDVFQERLYCIRYVNQPWTDKWKAFAILAKNHPDKTYSLWEIDSAWANEFRDKTARDLPLTVSGSLLREIQETLSQYGEDGYKILYTALRYPDKCTKEADSLVLQSKFTLFQIRIVVANDLKQVKILSWTLDNPESALFTPEKTPKTKKGKTNADEPSLLEMPEEAQYQSPPDTQFRYYTEPNPFDLEREDMARQLIQERFADWQTKGYIPSRKIESGDKTDEPIRTRGWTHWHHLFNPRQLLVIGSLSKKSNEFDKLLGRMLLLSVGRSINWNSKLSRWDSSAANERGTDTFSNQALNTLFTNSCRALLYMDTGWFNNIPILQSFKNTQNEIHVKQVNLISTNSDIWITDPPYADAVNYHELTEFFLAWYEKHIPKLFPEWYTDSRRALAIKGDGEDFRRSMVEAYKNLASHMPENGMQVVMFTHQDAGVWADLALILWASGLKVTAAWTIATETTSALKDGNYVQGTVLMILRKNNGTDSAFLDELIPEIEEEVKRQIESMNTIEDKEEPNFGDTDYQLAAYAASLRVLTGYKSLGDIQVEREIARPRVRGAEKSPLEKVIENAKGVATSYLIPDGITKDQWNGLELEERFYAKALDLESKGEKKAGIYQELARSYGYRDYESVMASLTANASRPKSPSEFGTSQMGTEGFGSSMIRYILFGIHTALEAGNPANGRFTLQTEWKSYWEKRNQAVWVLRYLGRLGDRMEHWAKASEMAKLLASLVENDRK
jgi:putative DNA methylase